jgi:glutathione synthase/RimK-type ligase-like ATP-grasp enzyme
VRVCFVTHRGAPGITSDDRHAAEACAVRGMEVSACPWDDPGVAWGDFDRIVLRSTWNYHLASGAFDAWLQELADEDLPVWNPVAVVRWNARKDYLLQLDAEGVPVVPTRILAPGDPPTPERWTEDFGTPDVVVKPAVGASAHGVIRTRLDTPGSVERLRAAAAGGAVLIQPFQRDVRDRGEWSAVFLDGAYSHAVLKRPAEGEFRVQEELGGRAVPGAAPDTIRELGRAALARVPGQVLYARVDAVEGPDGPRLMELELIEPALYLGTDAEAPARFAAALAAAPGSHGPVTPPGAPPPG